MTKKKIPPRKRQPNPVDLPQRPETWGVGTQQLRIWITPEDQPPSRPFVILILDLMNGFVMGADLAENAPSPDQARNALFKAMTQPGKGSGRPRRPSRVFFADPDLTSALSPALSEIGVECETQDLSMIPEIVGQLETSMRGGEPEHPGILSVPGVTPELAGGVFAAAAEFYRAEPWVRLMNEHIFAIRFPAEGGITRFVVTMGNAGVEYGLAIYDDWADVEKLFYGVDHPLESIPAQGQLTTFYEEIQRLPFDDLEAMQKYGWEVASDQAYPLPLYFYRTGGFRRPDAKELAWIEAALRAIPPLVRNHLRPGSQGDYQPFEITLTVPVHSGEAAVHAKYPGGSLAREKRPAAEEAWDWPGDEESEEEVPVFDRRIMEGMMSQMLGGGQMVSDKKLQKAQNTMYKAWEETNPAKRIALAHKALTISPDCADAYVLLAEEQADTVTRAVEHYQKGVEAGERALGPEFFKENAGHFWGILETRPYMRARKGLADTLWKLNRREEAVAHYRDMLRLNPSDNQGIRYILASSLLEMDRDDDLLELLKQYKDDAGAEWLYTWALVDFRKSGPAAASNRRLQKAIKYNPHVPSYLTGRKRVPNRLPDYIGIGDDREAASYAAEHLNYWRRTSGAVEWLKSRL